MGPLTVQPKTCQDPRGGRVLPIPGGETGRAPVARSRKLTPSLFPEPEAKSSWRGQSPLPAAPLPYLTAFTLPPAAGTGPMLACPGSWR